VEFDNKTCNCNETTYTQNYTEITKIRKKDVHNTTQTFSHLTHRIRALVRYK